MNVLGRLPAWATTGVGSVPYADPRRAAAHTVAHYDVPFCPQLVALEGDMVSQWLGADPQRCGWSPDRDRQRPLAWPELLAELDARPPAHGVVKLQVTGPATLACALERRGDNALSRRATLALAGEIATWLAANAAAWTNELSARGLTPLLMVDEPAVGVFGTRGVAAVWDPLRAIAPAWGLHLCCDVPWDVVDRAAPDVLSFDIALRAVDARGARTLLALIERGGSIAWGVIAGHRSEGASDALERLRPAFELVGQCGGSSLLTPSCGTGRLSVRRESAIAAALAATAAALRGERPAPAARRAMS